MLADDTIPRFATGVKFRFNEARGEWVLLAPERLFQPDEIAVEILKLVDGARSFGEITDALAARFQAPRPQIAGDVAALLQDLRERGALWL
jgi:pyrroloquinoline quinone biosynthesis protein D